MDDTDENNADENSVDVEMEILHDDNQENLKNDKDCGQRKKKQIYRKYPH